MNKRRHCHPMYRILLLLLLLLLDNRPRGAIPTVAMSSSDRFNWKTHPLESNTESLAVIQPKLYRFERLPAPLHAHATTDHVWYDVLA